MKQVVALLIVSLTFIGLSSTSVSSQNINTPANFPDPSFQQAVEQFLGVQSGGEFTAAQAAARTGSFSCIKRNITDMTGLEYLTGITRLYCTDN